MSLGLLVHWKPCRRPTALVLAGLVNSLELSMLLRFAALAPVGGVLSSGAVLILALAAGDGEQYLEDLAVRLDLVALTSRNQLAEVSQMAVALVVVYLGVAFYRSIMARRGCTTVNLDEN